MSGTTVLRAIKSWRSKRKKKKKDTYIYKFIYTMIYIENLFNDLYTFTRILSENNISFHIFFVIQVVSLIESLFAISILLYTFIPGLN